MEFLLTVVMQSFLIQSHLFSKGYEILLLIYITFGLWSYIALTLWKVSAKLRQYEQGDQEFQVEIHEAFKQMYLNRNVRTKYGTIGVVTDISKDKTGRPLVVNLPSGVSIPYSVDEVSLV